MKHWLMAILIGAAVALPAVADNLTGADRILCAAVQANVCTTDGQCKTGPPWGWNMPDFVVVDLVAKKLSTTPTSGDNRETPIRGLLREQGLIVLHGFEMGRAFSVLINEATGEASFAVAREHLTVSVFGSCTPLPGASGPGAK
jgi:hypothetical protein